MRPFRPRFALWSDGSSKRRWIHLPPGERIDSSDMDNWRFPRGAKLWKEFSPRLDVRATAYVLPWLGGSVGTALVWRALPSVYTARTASTVQLTTTPRVLFTLSSHVLLSIDASLALGGPLAGTASGALATQLTLD